MMKGHDLRPSPTPQKGSQNHSSDLLSSVYSVALAAGLTLAAAAAVNLIHRPLYSGEINYSGVEKVVVSPVHNTDFKTGRASLDGIRMEVTFNNRHEISIRDFNANYRLDPIDTVTSTTGYDPKPTELADILIATQAAATQQKVSRTINYPSIM